jgi:formylglycine-generating enzyme required for sulfatase activity
MTSKRMAMLVQQRGVDFALTLEIQKELRQAGAGVDLIEAIRRSHRAENALRGVEVREITDEEFSRSGYPERWPKVATVEKGTPASYAGIQPGDVISSILAPGQPRSTLFRAGATDFKANASRCIPNCIVSVNFKDVLLGPAVESFTVALEQCDTCLKMVHATDSSSELVWVKVNSPGFVIHHVQLRSGALSRVNPKDSLTYVWITPGIFQMGCSPGDNECRDDEKPSHQVRINKGFWIGQTPVTQAAYLRMTGANPSLFRGEQRPVEQVSWDEANAYCSMVGLRLPTEAEWEYAARAGGTGSRYGDLDTIAWYGDNSGRARIDSTGLLRDDEHNYGSKLMGNGNQTHPVMEKQPNAWRLYDVLGNVAEWTSDWYDEHYYGQSPAEDPRGPIFGEYRVTRGGSWVASARSLRVSGRFRNKPGFRSIDLGFRCAGEALGN